jgi:hypothetical protein
VATMWDRSDEAEWWGSEEEFLFHDELDRRSFLEWVAAGRIASIGCDGGRLERRPGGRFPHMEPHSLSREKRDRGEMGK